MTLTQKTGEIFQPSRRTFLTGMGAVAATSALSKNVIASPYGEFGNVWERNTKLMTPNIIPSEHVIFKDNRQTPYGGKSTRRLVLCLDFSDSMKRPELEIQRVGYAKAFRAPEVQRAVLENNGLPVCMTGFHTGSFDLIPWAFLKDPSDCEAYADHIDKTLSPITEPSGGSTNIVQGLHISRNRLSESPYDSMYSVIDVSGDGVNSDGPVSLQKKREAMVSNDNRLIINTIALPGDIQSHNNGGKKSLSEYFLSYLVWNGRNFKVSNWKEFPDKIRNKLLFDTAGKLPNNPKIQFT